MAELTPSAVFVALRRPAEGPLEIGFATRSPDSTTHAGHVGFPGGTVESVDDSLRDTARRETIEETALGPEDFTISARLGDHHTRSTGFALAPFLGIVGSPNRFVPDSREVVDTFWASVPDLRAAYQMDGNRIRFPIGNREVWGVTGRIVVSLLVPGIDSHLA